MEGIVKAIPVEEAKVGMWICWQSSNGWKHSNIREIRNTVLWVNWLDAPFSLLPVELKEAKTLIVEYVPSELTPSSSRQILALPIHPVEWQYTIDQDLINNDRKLMIFHRLTSNPDIAVPDKGNYSLIDIIGFGVWYSGMDQAKVVSAWNRYVLEIRKKP